MISALSGTPRQVTFPELLWRAPCGAPSAAHELPPPLLHPSPTLQPLAQPSPPSLAEIPGHTKAPLWALMGFSQGLEEHPALGPQGLMLPSRQVPAHPGALRALLRPPWRRQQDRPGALRRRSWNSKVPFVFQLQRPCRSADSRTRGPAGWWGWPPRLYGFSAHRRGRT